MDSRILILTLLPVTAGFADPPLTPLVPGFTVEELPVRLTNVNNLVFAPDGRLFALGYDGRVHVLRDTDGDGLEDRAEPFWDRPTIRVPVGMAWAPEGLYVSSNGKVSLLIDSDRDGKADREEVMASGWVPPDNPSGGVDALGVTRDREGNLYFGLGCADYSNAYRLKDGRAGYDLRSERGTILRLSADRKRREIVCTGIRFPYSIDFNSRGDLFATDQEGETWLPGGNPLDELNHLVPGRHYGFPPAHPAHLPNVVNEPPAAVFSPQHQSSCGMTFNEPLEGRGPIGPGFWRGNALVAGFSRGKIWRVALVKTARGYLGKTIPIFACAMLAADLDLSPRGDLYLTCHSGPPDWGTGPQGEGKIFRIRHSHPEAAQPVAAWAAGPLEVCVAFDRPLALTPSALTALAGLPIAFGEYVRAGDRLEVTRPGYKVVERQQASPRGALKIVAATLEQGGTLLRLRTDPHALAVTYNVTLPLLPLAGASAPAGGPPIDLQYDLTGVEARWRAPGGVEREDFSGWLPSADLEVSRALLQSAAGPAPPAGSPVTLQCKIDFSRNYDFLREGLPMAGLPTEEVSLRLESTAPFEAALGPVKAASRGEGGGRHAAELTALFEGSPLDFRAKLEAAESLSVSFRTQHDPTWRPLPLHWQLLPWAERSARPAPPVTVTGPAAAGGDPARGEAVFFGDRGRCSVCHTFAGRGGKAGPDLTHLSQRDAASVLRDITDPGASINPDFVSFTAVLHDRRTLVGLVRAEGTEAVRVTGADAHEEVVPRSRIADLRANAVSLMPSDLPAAIGEEGMRDLLAFLLKTRDSPLFSEKGPPPARARSEVEAVLGVPPPGPGAEPRRLKILLVAGPQDHGPGEHDYPAWQRSWEKLLGVARGVRVATATGWPDGAQWSETDLVVCYFWNHDWSEARYRDLDAFLARGGGAVFLHAAMIADRDPESLAGRLGLSAEPKRTRYRHGPLELRAVAPPEHPLTRGFRQARLIDETYWPLIGDPSRVEVLATAMEEEKPWPMLWTYRPGKGRVFCSVLGHYTWTLDDPLFRILILRGMAWAAGEPVDRFEPLALEGMEGK